MEFAHIPVMLNECMDALKLSDNGVYIDCTIGGAGHSYELLKRTKNTRLIGIDQDIDALTATKKRLAEFGDRVILVNDNFKNLLEILKNLKIDKVDGILVDLGVSSYQLDTAERGFSHRFDAKLDMRMNQQQSLSAYEVVNSYSVEQLKSLIYNNADEKFAGSIARHIVKAREIAPIQTTGQLKDIILSSVPRYKGHDGSSNVQRTFQAIRIEVNGELSGLTEFIHQAITVLNTYGRLAIISFHSTEDRIVKRAFKDLSTDCICPPDFPICVCSHRALGKVIGKITVATPEELSINRRSTSAKLRVIEKI